MINVNLEFELPPPWVGQRFNLSDVPYLSLLVGPNGSGKSQLARTLANSLPNARLLGTDRLSEFAQKGHYFGDSFAQGYNKNIFSALREQGRQLGSGADAIVLLEERPSLRVLVEATLTSLFGRKIWLEWNSGSLVPRATLLKTGHTYRLDREECHGIKELLVLLTHLYDDQHKYLIIDEPELNLHPQYQSFFLQEVRRVAGDPALGGYKKGIFLITHSPFMLDIRTAEDLAGVFSFDSTHSTPRKCDLTLSRRAAQLLPRINVSQKQLFFSDNPIFVEGQLDAQLIEAMQYSRSFSTTGAGSCVIDVGGCEEANKYVELCKAMGKTAHFVYDLDSLFTGTLRRCISGDSVAEFLATLGVNPNFAAYCGELDRELAAAIAKVRETEDLPLELQELKLYLERLLSDAAADPGALPKARVALLIALGRSREIVSRSLGPIKATEIECRLENALQALRTCGIHVLPGGAIEHYIPSYTGDRFQLREDQKRSAITEEVAELLSRSWTSHELHDRYGKLFEVVQLLPAKPPVDIDSLLIEYASDYVHALQGMLVSNPSWGLAELKTAISASHRNLEGLFEVLRLERTGAKAFTVEILVRDLTRERRIFVSEKTNAGIRDLELVS